MVVKNVWRMRGVRGKFWCARRAVTKVAFYRRLGHLYSSCAKNVLASSSTNTLTTKIHLRLWKFDYAKRRPGE